MSKNIRDEIFTERPALDKRRVVDHVANLNHNTESPINQRQPLHIPHISQAPEQDLQAVLFCSRQDHRRNPSHNLLIFVFFFVQFLTAQSFWY